MTNSAFHTVDGANRAPPEASLEFGRFRGLLRQRLLLADDEPIESGTRAFDLLLALLEADGTLVSREQLSSRVWRGTVVAQNNLKVEGFAAQSSWRRSRLDPYRVWPRVLVHCHSPLERRLERMPASGAAATPINSMVVSAMDHSAIFIRLVR
jgi:hypothetical protein